MMQCLTGGTQQGQPEHLLLSLLLLILLFLLIFILFLLCRADLDTFPTPRLLDFWPEGVLVDRHSYRTNFGLASINQAKRIEKQLVSCFKALC